MPGPWASLKPKIVALWLRRPLIAPHVVCWHGDIVPNLRASTVPLVEFTLRPYPDDASPPEFLPPGAFGPPTTRSFPATTLGQYRLGSAIKRRESEDTLPEHLTPKDFDVDFSQSGWSLELASEALVPYDPLPAPWLQGLSLDSPLIVFQMAGGRTLLVPCVEFFSRCYGHSKELQRVLLTYPWSVVERRLFRTLEPPPPGYEGTWYVRFGPGMTKADAAFLAHIQYDGYTRGAVKRIYAKREAASGSPDPQVPLDVGPWFQECAKLRVRGYQLDGSTFLALRVDGSSEPTQGPPVYFERAERTSRQDDSQEEPGSGDEQPGLWRRIFHPPRDLPTHAGRDPDAAAGSGRVADPDFAILGERRAVFPSPRKRDSDGRRSGSVACECRATSRPLNRVRRGKGLARFSSSPCGFLRARAFYSTCGTRCDSFMSTTRTRSSRSSGSRSRRASGPTILRISSSFRLRVPLATKGESFPHRTGGA